MKCRCGRELDFGVRLEYCPFCSAPVEEAAGFETKDGVLIEYNGYGKEIIIPDDVIVIDRNAFANCNTIETVTIPQNVRVIGSGAFSHCKNLRQLNVSDNVQAIGSSAFSSCPNLESVKLPPEITTIEEWVFCNCPSLKEISIPNGVETIKSGAFKDCASLENVNIPDNVTEISDDAFNGCEKLTIQTPKDSNIQRYCEKNNIAFKSPKYTFSNVKTGDTVEFGNYYKSSEESKEPIEWQVLEKTDNEILLISKHVLDKKMYFNRRQDITWSECSLREWLNDEFLNTAFSEEEQNMLLNSNVTPDSNPRYATHAGYLPTTNKIFLLSIDETEKYFPTNASKKSTPTAFAQRGSSFVHSWWLRTPGEYKYTVAYVDGYGVVIFTGIGVDFTIGVRPALRIKL